MKEVFQILRQVRGIVVGDDNLVFGEFRALGRQRDNINFEEAGLFEFFLQDRRGELPFVIRAAALAIDKHYSYRRSRRRKWQTLPKKLIFS